MEQNSTSGMIGRIRSAIAFFNRVRNLKAGLNRRMEGKYSPSLIALLASAAAAFLLLLMLFVPNCLGVADDGSVSGVMNAAGVCYIGDKAADNYNNYFVKIYSNVLSGHPQRGGPATSHILLVRAAVRLDTLVTGDRFFDIRFLALLYGILYVPAVYLLIREACRRVKSFSEGAAVGLAGALMFADVAYVAYFNSFYPEAVWFISLLYCLGAAVSFQEERSAAGDAGYLALFTAAGLVLTTSKSQCALLGFVLALYCLRLIFAGTDFRWGILCVLAAVLLSLAAVFCMARMDSDFDETSKFHAMTRGVLFSSDDPARTLAEFGIAPSYEMLTDVSSYEELPFVKADNPLLSEGFLDRYTTLDIGMYYLRHPGKFLQMTDLAVKSCFGIRRDSCGNYEKRAGLPPGAKSIFWSVWSTFKNNSAPKTAGYVAVLTAAAFLLFGKGYSVRPEGGKRSGVLLDSMLLLLLLCLVQAGVVILHSGDAEMIRHCFLISGGVDIMTYFIFAGLVHRINIF